ncbi:MAG: IS21 family transposase [Desulfuromonadales bacterium]|nr:IS21 family transposase [Desulfuromonadales bacterium]
MDIVALKRQGHSLRWIARKLGIHRSTVKKHLESDSFPAYVRKAAKPSILEPYHQVIRDFLDEDDYQATWIFERLKRRGYSGSYDTLKVFVRSIKEQKCRIAYTRFETEPGLQAQVDWGDFKVVDSSGKITTVYAFVMVLGFSRAMYVEFVERCTMEAFMDCHLRAFKLLRGVPAEILYDNMKHVVIGRGNGKPTFNVEFFYFSKHYGFTPRLCPPYSPWVKGKVERPMDYLRENFWRGYSYRSLSQANEDVVTWITETAHQRIHGTYRQQVKIRWEQEIPHLGPIPATDYDTSLRFSRKVYKDCLISFGGNRYYVTPQVVGKRVLLKIKNGVMRIYFDADLLAVYQIPETKGETIGNPPRLSRTPHKTPWYGRDKGKATRGLVTHTLYPEVYRRPLAEYDRYAVGGASWSN